MEETKPNVPKNSTTSDEENVQKSCHEIHRPKLLLYGFIGGFYFSSRFQPRVKYTWLLTNLAILTIAIPFGTVGYLMSSSLEKSSADVIYAVLMAKAEFFFIFVVPIVTYYFRHTLEEALDLNDGYFYQNRMPLVATKVRKSNDKFTRILLLHAYIAIMYVASHLVFMFFYDETELQYVHIYIYPNSWVQNVQSRSHYYVIFLVQASAASISFISVIAFSTFIVVIGQEFETAFLILKHYLKELTALQNNFGHRVEEGVNTKTENEKQQQVTEEDETKTEVIGQESSVNIALLEAILAHQVLRRKMKSMKLYIESLFSLVLFMLVGDQCLFVFIMCTETVERFLKTKELIAVMYIHVILFTFCYVGKLFDEMEEMISTQVYSTPWYYLTPKQRKILFIFLCQTQKSIQFLALNIRVYVMNMPVLTQNLKLIFTLFNILRQVLHKYNK